MARGSCCLRNPFAKSKGFLNRMASCTFFLIVSLFICNLLFGSLCPSLPESTSKWQLLSFFFFPLCPGVTSSFLGADRGTHIHWVTEGLLSFVSSTLLFSVYPPGYPQEPSFSSPGWFGHLLPLQLQRHLQFPFCSLIPSRLWKFSFLCEMSPSCLACTSHSVYKRLLWVLSQPLLSVSCLGVQGSCGWRSRTGWPPSHGRTWWHWMRHFSSLATSTAWSIKWEEHCLTFLTEVVWGSKRTTLNRSWKAE